MFGKSHSDETDGELYPLSNVTAVVYTAVQCIPLANNTEIYIRYVVSDCRSMLCVCSRLNLIEIVALF